MSKTFTVLLRAVELLLYFTIVMFGKTAEEQEKWIYEGNVKSEKHSFLLYCQSIQPKILSAHY